MRTARSAPYRSGLYTRQFAETDIFKLLKQDVIEPVTTELASTTLFVRKKDGLLHFHVDYRKLNAITVQEFYLFPRMDVCINQLDKTTIFSTFGTTTGCCKNKIDRKDYERTTFTSSLGLFQLTRLQFRLRDDPAAFQRGMKIKLLSVGRRSAVVYLDEIIFFSETVKDHLLQRRQVFVLLRDSGETQELKSVPS